MKMKKDLQEIYDSIPSKWDEVKIKDLMKLGVIDVAEKEGEEGFFNGVDNTLETLSIFTGISVEELESKPAVSVQLLAKKLDFMMKFPEPNKTSNIVWKNVNEFTYGDFV
jgi:hypothetical protein